MVFFVVVVVVVVNASSTIVNLNHRATMKGPPLTLLTVPSPDEEGGRHDRRSAYRRK